MEVFKHVILCLATPVQARDILGTRQLHGILPEARNYLDLVQTVGPRARYWAPHEPKILVLCGSHQRKPLVAFVSVGGEPSGVPYLLATHQL